MIKNLANIWLKRKTNNFTNIPLFYITFNYEKFIKHGASGSCDICFHPDFNNDKELQSMLFNVVDYIRNNYNMENFTKI